MRRIRISVETELCKGCGICILLCPARILEEDEPTPWGGYRPRLVSGGETRCLLVRGRGTSCRLCEKRCPDAAISVEVEEE